MRTERFCCSGRTASPPWDLACPETAAYWTARDDLAHGGLGCLRARLLLAHDPALGGLAERPVGRARGIAVEGLDAGTGSRDSGPAQRASQGAVPRRDRNFVNHAHDRRPLGRLQAT